MLKLLSPKEVKDASEERELDDFKRASALKDVTKRLLDENARAERQFSETLDSQRARFELEETEHREKIFALRKELSDLKEERDRKLIPIALIQENLHNRGEALLVLERESLDRKASLEEEGRILMERLDEVSEREQKVLSQEKKQKSLQEGIEAQRQQVGEGAKALSKQITDFELSKRQTEQDFSKQRSLLDAEKQLQAERLLQLTKEKTRLENVKSQLADQRATLERAFKRIENGKR